MNDIDKTWLQLEKMFEEYWRYWMNVARFNVSNIKSSSQLVTFIQIEDVIHTLDLLTADTADRAVEIESMAQERVSQEIYNMTWQEVFNTHRQGAGHSGVAKLIFSQFTYRP